MKNIYLKAYVNCNLGDDLFIYMITKRYSKCKFNLITNKKYNINYNGNLSIKHYNFVNRVINKIIKVITNSNNSLENYLMQKSDLTVLIGGSMFIEGNNYNSKYFIGGGKPYYILGSNFGPYRTKEYYNKFYDIFKNAEDVSFREKYSYDLFSDLKNVHFTSDLVFSLDVKNIKIENNKRVVFSIIGEGKINSQYNEQYEKFIIDTIKFFKDKGYEILLMSFCKNEGDEEKINKIINKFDDKDNISKYFYSGNFKEALDLIGTSEIIIGTRFHANILGLVMNKAVIPIAYSDKTINTLKDINFKGKFFDIRKLENFDSSCLESIDLNYRCDISLQRKEAELHFKELDKVLERG